MLGMQRHYACAPRTLLGTDQQPDPLCPLTTTSGSLVHTIRQTSVSFCKSSHFFPPRPVRTRPWTPAFGILFPTADHLAWCLALKRAIVGYCCSAFGLIETKLRLKGMYRTVARMVRQVFSRIRLVSFHFEIRARNGYTGGWLQRRTGLILDL